MTKRKKSRLRRRSRLGRIECKCDRILAELLILRRRPDPSPMDEVIDKMHGLARKMRRHCLDEHEDAKHCLVNSPGSWK